MKFLFPAFERTTTQIHVIGAGGTGSALIAALCKLAMIAKAVDLPPIEVTLWDDDVVSPSNVGRQAFTKADLGLNKARVLINRCNLTYGLNWKAKAVRFEHRLPNGFTVLMGCVDTRTGRKAMMQAYQRSANAMWIDCGNGQTSGQVVMGVRERSLDLLPSVADLFPETVAAEDDAKDDAPSCSVAQSIARQDPMTNQLVADQAAGLLWRFMRFGETEASGAFIDVESFNVNPMPIDKAYWASLGWTDDRQLKLAA